MQEVGADREMRQKINVYKRQEGASNLDEEMVDLEQDDDDDQQVKLDELLDGLALDSGPDLDEDGDYYSQGWSPEGERAAKDGIGYFGREAARVVQQNESAVPVTGNQFSKEFILDDH